MTITTGFGYRFTPGRSLYRTFGEVRMTKTDWARVGTYCKLWRRSHISNFGRALRGEKNIRTTSGFGVMK